MNPPNKLTPILKIQGDENAVNSVSVDVNQEMAIEATCFKPNKLTLPQKLGIDPVVDDRAQWMEKLRYAFEYSDPHGLGPKTLGEIERLERELAEARKDAERLRDVLLLIANAKPHIAEDLDWREEYMMLQGAAIDAARQSKTRTKT